MNSTLTQSTMMAQPQHDDIEVGPDVPFLDAGRVSNASDCSTERDEDSRKSASTGTKKNIFVIVIVGLAVGLLFVFGANHFTCTFAPPQKELGDSGSDAVLAAEVQEEDPDLGEDVVAVGTEEEDGLMEDVVVSSDTDPAKSDTDHCCLGTYRGTWGTVAAGVLGGWGVAAMIAKAYYGWSRPVGVPVDQSKIGVVTLNLAGPSSGSFEFYGQEGTPVWNIQEGFEILLNSEAEAVTKDVRTVFNAEMQNALVKLIETHYLGDHEAGGVQAYLKDIFSNKEKGRTVKEVFLWVTNEKRASRPSKNTETIGGKNRPSPTNTFFKDTPDGMIVQADATSCSQSGSHDRIDLNKWMETWAVFMGENVKLDWLGSAKIDKLLQEGEYADYADFRQYLESKRDVGVSVDDLMKEVQEELQSSVVCLAVFDALLIHLLDSTYEALADSGKSTAHWRDVVAAQPDSGQKTKALTELISSAMNGTDMQVAFLQEVGSSQEIEKAMQGKEFTMLRNGDPRVQGLETASAILVRNTFLAEGKSKTDVSKSVMLKQNGLTGNGKNMGPADICATIVSGRDGHDYLLVSIHADSDGKMTRSALEAVTSTKKDWEDERNQTLRLIIGMDANSHRNENPDAKGGLDTYDKGGKLILRELLTKTLDLQLQSCFQDSSTMGFSSNVSTSLKVRSMIQTQGPKGKPSKEAKAAKGDPKDHIYFEKDMVTSVDAPESMVYVPDSCCRDSNNSTGIKAEQMTNQLLPTPSHPTDHALVRVFLTFT